MNLVKRNLLIIIILGFQLSSANTKGQNIVAEYELKINKDNPYVVSIKASFTNKVDTLLIHPACPNYDYPNGWSTFIKPKNRNLIYLGKNKWKANSQTISYEVDLSFVKKDWDVGNEQAGKFINNSMFVVTRALFLFSEIEGNSKIVFKTPSNFKVSTSWEKIENETYLVNSKASLTNNTVVWGATHLEKTITKDDFTLNIVLLDSNIIDTPKMIVDVFSGVLSEYVKNFPKTPSSNYLITVFSANQNDGESYTSSNAFTLKNKLSNQNKSIWANQFAHELFHFWNGRMINGPERQKRQWFSEGFTEYFSNLALVRTGVITKHEFYRMIEKSIGLYYYFKNNQYPNVSLVDAGFKKSKYRFGVYNGGWNVAFILDMMIMSNDESKSLEDFMNLMFEDYGLNKKEYMYEDLVSEFDKYLGGKGRLFFEKYISGTDTLPLEDYFDMIGIKIDYTSYEGTAYIYESTHTDKAQSSRRFRWLNNN